MTNLWARHMNRRVAEGTFGYRHPLPGPSGILVVLASLLWWGVSEAHAIENRTMDPSVSTYANYETVSVYATYAGDDNATVSARFEYKDAASVAWLTGMPMHKIIDEKRFAAFFFAQPNTSYDVRVTFTDRDGVVGRNPVATTVITRSDQIPIGSGKVYYVSPRGSDSNPGTSVLPFKTLSKAASVVVAGDTVYVRAGTYRERVNLIGKSGTASNWITFQGFGDGPAILDGSDPEFVLPGQSQWSVYSVSVYRMPLSYVPEPYVAIDGLRAYHYPSLASLLTGISGIPAGWVYESGFLYLKTKDGSDPDLHVIQVARQKYGFELGDSHYLKIKGFTMQYFGGAGIRFNGGETNIVVEDNTIQNNSFGIRKGGRGGSTYTIQHNTVSETEVFTWPWDKVKKTEHEGTGIALFAIDRGAIVRDNVISGYFDGVQINLWPPALGYNFDSDVYRNAITDCGDDGTELEGSNQTNIRFWENTMTRCFSGMSLAPVLKGPVYLFRNTGSQIIQQGFKVGSAGFTGTGLESVGAVYAFHNTIHAIDDVGNDDDAVQCIKIPGYQNHTYRNNVFYTGRYVIVHGYCTSAGTTYDYDLMYTKDTSRFVQWDNRAWYPTLARFQAGTGQARHAINAIPQFENVATGDLRLTATSPGIDAGIVLVGFNDAHSPWPSVGSQPDLGAFEVGEPAPVDPPPVIPPGVNQPPVLAPIGNQVVQVGNVLTFLISASDPDSDALIYSVANLPAGATFTGLTFSWQPGAGQAGTYQLTFTVSDGELTDAETITITVATLSVAIGSLKDSPDPFSPNGDGAKDTTTISATFNKPVTWQLQIKDPSVSVVRTFTGSGTTVNQVWDGRTSTGVLIPDVTYTYVLTGTDVMGSSASKSGTTTIDTVAPILSGLSDSPDPFDPRLGQTTTISFTISEASLVTLRIYNSAGSLMKSLLTNASKSSGSKSIKWNGKDNSGVYVPAGTYTYKIWIEDKAGNRASLAPASGTVTVQ